MFPFFSETAQVGGKAELNSPFIYYFYLQIYIIAYMTTCLGPQFSYL